MKEWLTDHLISCADEIPESAEGHCLGRGLPFRLLREMQVGLWSPSDRDAPDPTFRQRYGNRGGELDGWISVPMWSPRGKVVGVEFRRWDGEKGSQKFFLPDSRWLPVFTGLVPSVLNRIWKGGDVWLVEGLFDLSIAHAIVLARGIHGGVLESAKASLAGSAPAFRLHARAISGRGTFARRALLVLESRRA